MSPYQAFKQILLTESQRHPAVADSPTSSSRASPSTAPPSTSNHAPTEADEAAAPPPATLCHPDRTLAISLSRIGTSTQRLISGTLTELASLPEEEFGPPLHSVVIVGKRLHPLELEYAGRFAIGGEAGAWWKVGREVYGVERETFG